MQTIPFKTSFFAEEENPARTEALAGDSHADVVIVGGGIVGLSCAYALREEGLDVALLEREHVGYASSGRNMGVVAPAMWNLGAEQPELLAAWAQGCLDETEEVLAAEGIECQFRRCPFRLLGVKESDARELPLLAEYFAQLGLPAHFVEAEKVEFTTYKNYGALVMEDQAMVDPWRLVRGMREAILRKGVRLYEGTPVESIEGGTQVLVKTPGGTLRAPKAVLALNAFSGQFPFLQKYVVPSLTCAIATEPLDESTAKTVGTANEEVVMDYGRIGERRYYQRFRLDRRLIFGGGVPAIARPSDRMEPDPNAEGFRDIHAEMIRRYPALETVAVEAAWGGAICTTIGELPIIKEVPEQENLIMAVVGNGHGMGVGSNAAGKLVKGLVLGVDKLDAPARAFLERCRGRRELRHKVMQAGWAAMRSRILGPPARKLAEGFLGWRRKSR